MYGSASSARPCRNRKRSGGVLSRQRPAFKFPHPIAGSAGLPERLSKRVDEGFLLLTCRSHTRPAINTLADTPLPRSGTNLTIVTICLVVLTGIAGMAELAGAKPLADQSQGFGLPKAMMFLVGSLDFAASIGLNFQRLTFHTSCELVILMLGDFGTLRLFGA